MTQACPICRKPSVQATRPFCSKRCADIDMGRWLSAQYVVPGASGEAARDQDDRPVPERTMLDPGEPVG